MLLDQAPASPETMKLIDLIVRYGMKIRLLNVRFEETLTGFNDAAAERKNSYGLLRDVVLPSREGVDDDFFYG